MFWDKGVSSWGEDSALRANLLLIPLVLWFALPQYPQSGFPLDKSKSEAILQPAAHSHTQENSGLKSHQNMGSVKFKTSAPILWPQYQFCHLSMQHALPCLPQAACRQHQPPSAGNFWRRTARAVPQKRDTSICGMTSGVVLERL